MWLHPLTNFEIQKYYKNKPMFNGVYSKNNLPKIRDGLSEINLDEFKSIGSHWKAFYVNGNIGRASYDAIYCDSFGVEHIPKEVKKFIGNKIIITNIYRIQSYDLTMCGDFSIKLIDLILKSKRLPDYNNLFFLKKIWEEW